ncbi:hypothetical protein Tco_1570588 [Tanacetum coccineum]
MVTSMGIRHAKPYTLRGGPSTKLEQRLFKAWQLNNHSKNSSISSKPDRAHICTISGAIRGTATISPDILLPLWPTDPPFSQDPKSSQDDGSKPSSEDEKKVDEDPRKDCESIDQEKDDNVNSTNNVNAANTNKVNACLVEKLALNFYMIQKIPALGLIIAYYLNQ